MFPSQNIKLLKKLGFVIDRLFRNENINFSWDFQHSIVIQRFLCRQRIPTFKFWCYILILDMSGTSLFRSRSRPGPDQKGHFWSRSKKNFGPGSGSEPLCPSLMRIMIYFNINMLFFSSISTFLSNEIHLIFVFFSTINEASVLLQMLRYAAASLNDFSECFRRIFITHELWQYDIQHKSYTSVKIIILNKKKCWCRSRSLSKKNFWPRDRDRDHFAISISIFRILVRTSI